LCAKRSLDFPSWGARWRAGWFIRSPRNVKIKKLIKTGLFVLRSPMKNGYLLGVDTRTSGSQSTMRWDSIPDYWESKPVRRLGVNSRQVPPLAHRHWESIPVLNYQSRVLDVGVNPRCFAWWQWESIPDLKGAVGTGGRQSPLMNIYGECANATKQSGFLCRFVQFCFSRTCKMSV
jgi:hypothetical protein